MSKKKWKRKERLLSAVCQTAWMQLREAYVKKTVKSDFDCISV